MNNIDVIKQPTEGTYRVSITRHLCPDRKFHISPSYGYAGVTPGVVEILSIIEGEDYVKKVEDYPEITQFISIEVTGCDKDIDPNTLNTEQTQMYLDLVKQAWVEYHYPHVEEEGTYWFPIKMFVEHTSML